MLLRKSHILHHADFSRKRFAGSENLQVIIRIVSEEKQAHKFSRNLLRVTLILILPHKSTYLVRASLQESSETKSLSRSTYYIPHTNFNIVKSRAFALRT
jgi:hypothetical protein